MPLIQLLESTPEIVLQYNCKQIVSAAGDGVLTDDSECSIELRHYLKHVPIEKLFEHVEYCLNSPFDKSGYALQDIVNELGRRLDYDVENGLYQGRANTVGFDGLWSTPLGPSIVVEVKTSDAYRINLDKGAARYRDQLVEQKKISKNSSILIVVGRAETGDLEAQIRGSRHAWDTRIISTAALIQLVELKVKSDEDETTEKIRSLLVPFEYTRLDNIIDVMFSAAKDVEAATADETPGSAIEESDTEVQERQQEHTPMTVLAQVRKASLDALAREQRTTFIAHKRAQYWNSDKSIRAVCPVSKVYPSGGYWYAFHPHQKRFLAEAERGFLLLGCVDSNLTYSIPLQKVLELIPSMNTTEKENGRTYWHVHLQPSETNGQQQMILRRGERISLAPYTIQLNPKLAR